MINVPPDGPKTAKLIFVGEAPGADEELARKPFVGESGKVLERALAEAGLLRQEVYITNAFKSHPPHNNISKFVRRSKDGSYVPTDDGIPHILQLQQELNSLPGAVIVPMGNVALWACSTLTPISAYRGSILPFQDQANRWMIPTFHPTNCLPTRSPENFHVLKADLKKAARVANNPKWQPTNRSMKFLRTFAEMSSCLINIWSSHTGIIALDIETSMSKGTKGRAAVREMIMFSLATSKDQAYVFELWNPKTGNTMTPLQEQTVLTILCEIMLAYKIQILGQNLHFDLSVLYHRYKIYARNIHDTFVAQRLCFPEFEANLAYLNSLYTDIPYYKDAGKKTFKDMSNADWDAFMRYSALDVLCLHEIHAALQHQLTVMGNLPIYTQTMNLFPILTHMQDKGLGVNQHALQAAATNTKAQADALQEILNQKVATVYAANWKPSQKLLDAVTAAQTKYSLKPTKTNEKSLKKAKAALNPPQTLNVKSTQAKREFFYSKNGLHLPALSNKGVNQSTDKKSLKRLAGKGATGATEILQITQLRDDLTKYFTVPLDPDGRMRGQFTPLTDQGRLACKGSLFGTGNNLQNQPTRMKKALTASVGHFCGWMDLAQAENRLVAYLANEERMIDAFETGKDVHCLTAALISGMTPEQVLQQKRDYDAALENGLSTKAFCAPLGTGDKPWRDWGKRANHALNYGMGWMLLALEYEISAKDAKFLHGAYHKAYPNVEKVFWKECRDSIYSKRVLENLMGRRRYFLGFLNDETWKVAYSFKPQSTIADIMCRFGLPAMASCKTICLTNQVHDSVCFEIPADEARLDEAAREILSVAAATTPTLEAHGRQFTIPIELEVGPNYAQGEKLKLDSTLPDALKAFAGRLK